MRRKSGSRRRFVDRLKEEMQDKAFCSAYKEADLAVRLALQIAYLRERQGLTQRDLARRVGTKQQVISRIEQFKQTNLTLDTLQKLARAFKMELVVDLRATKAKGG